jgi:plastocyanin
MDDPFAFLTASHGSQPEHHRRPHLWPFILLFMVLLATAVALLAPAEPVAPETDAGPTPVPAREARMYTVIYRFDVFSPTNLRIHLGDTVRFRNDGSVPVRIVADLAPGQQTPEFDSIGPIPPDGTFSYTFAKAGIFGYHTYDDENQTGVIIVRE